MLLCILKKILPPDIDLPINKTQELLAEEKRSGQPTNLKRNPAYRHGKQQKVQHRRVSGSDSGALLPSHDDGNEIGGNPSASASKRLEQIKSGQYKGGIRKRVS